MSGWLIAQPSRSPSPFTYIFLFRGSDLMSVVSESFLLRHHLLAESKHDIDISVPCRTL